MSCFDEVPWRAASTALGFVWNVAGHTIRNGGDVASTALGFVWNYDNGTGYQTATEGFNRTRVRLELALSILRELLCGFNRTRVRLEQVEKTRTDAEIALQPH